MKKVLMMLGILAAVGLMPVTSEAHGYPPPPVHHSVMHAAPMIIGHSVKIIVIGGSVAYDSLLLGTFFAPVIIRQTNPLCNWWTCFDDKGRPFIDTGDGPRPQD